MRQDSGIKISYSEWSREAKDHIKARGAQGRWLAGIPEWSERRGDVPITDEAFRRLGVPDDMMGQMAYAVYMFIKNNTAGHVKVVIQHGVCNGIDAWRKLCRDQLPLADDKRNLVMPELLRPKEAANASGLRKLTLEIERLTDNWEILLKKRSTRKQRLANYGT